MVSDDQDADKSADKSDERAPSDLLERVLSEDEAAASDHAGDKQGNAEPACRIKIEDNGEIRVKREREAAE